MFFKRKKTNRKQIELGDEEKLSLSIIPKVKLESIDESDHFFLEFFKISYPGINGYYSFNVTESVNRYKRRI